MESFAQEPAVELRTGVWQKPVSLEMLSEPHGLHNYAEYREVLHASRNSQENVHFWARYGLARFLGRRCRHLSTSLRINCSSLVEDEYGQLLTFFRMASPMLVELEQRLPSAEDFALRVQDYSSLNRLLSRDLAVDDDVLHWARFGVFEGVDSWRHVSDMVLTGKMPLLELRGVTHEPETFIRHADMLTAAHNR